MTSIAVCGSFVTDLVVRVERHPRPGETLFGRSFDTWLGGKGFNQALAARRLGASVEMIGSVGADPYGDAFLAALDADGIGRAHVHRSDGGTGVAVPMVADDGQNTIVVVPRANLALRVEDVLRARAVLEASRALVLQLEIPLDACLAAASLARAASSLVVWNLAPFAPVPAGSLAAADVIVVNEAEAAGLLGETPASPAHAVAAARAIVALGVGAAVVTLGAGGAAWASRDADGHAPAHAVKAVDTVGAGDAFCGALALSLARGLTLAEAVAWGNAAGALATTVHGAAPSMPRADAVEAMLRGR